MQLSIAGVHMDTSEALRAHVQERIEGLTTYFDQVLDVQVKFTQENHHKNLHHADITMHAGDLMLRAEGEGGDWYACVDVAIAKIAKQLKKYKGKLEQRRAQHQEFKEKLRDRGPFAFEHHTMVERVDGEAGDTGLQRVFEGVYGEFAPDISKKEVSRIAPMSVDEAVMQMDLLHKPAFLFMNVETQELNMVYREGENAIRWVAPKAA